MKEVGYYLGWLLSLSAACGIMVTVIHHEWKHSSNMDSPLYLNTMHFTEGLWLQCVFPGPGYFECNAHGALLELPSQLHGRRAMMVISEICAFAGFVLGTMSMPCTTLKKKVFPSRIAGILMVLAGLLCLIPVSMYAKIVVDDFRDPHKSKQIKYTFGPALYVGWVSSGLSLLSGILLACCSRDLDHHETPLMAKMVYV